MNSIGSCSCYNPDDLRGCEALAWAANAAACFPYIHAILQNIRLHAEKICGAVRADAIKVLTTRDIAVGLAGTTGEESLAEGFRRLGNDLIEALNTTFVETDIKEKKSQFQKAVDLLSLYARHAFEEAKLTIIRTGVISNDFNKEITPEAVVEAAMNWAEGQALRIKVFGETYVTLNRHVTVLVPSLVLHARTIEATEILISK